MDYPPPRTDRFWRSPESIALLVLSVAGGFFLFTEHRAHLLGALPYLILLACPLMHVFMHHGHHHGQAGQAPSRREPNREADDGTPR